MTDSATGGTPETVGITPKALETPRAAGLAGVVFAVLFGVIVVLLRKVAPADPHAPAAWGSAGTTVRSRTTMTPNSTANATPARPTARGVWRAFGVMSAAGTMSPVAVFVISCS